MFILQVDALNFVEAGHLEVARDVVTRDHHSALKRPTKS